LVPNRKSAIGNRKFLGRVVTLAGETKKIGTISLNLALILTLLLCCFPVGSVAAQNQSTLTWKDTGFAFPNIAPEFTCFDYTQPGILYLSVSQPISPAYATKGTYSFNWNNGEVKLVNAVPFTRCDEQYGVFYGAPEVTRTVRFSPTITNPYPVEQMPSFFSRDGQRLQYAANPGAPNGGELHFSVSDGLSWIKRTPPLATSKRSSAMMPEIDSRSLYWLGCPNATNAQSCELYFSGNSGGTWEKRSQVVSYTGTVANLMPMRGYYPPATSVMIELLSTGKREIIYSADSGKNFVSLGTHFVQSSPSGSQPSEKIDIFYTAEGLLRYSVLRTGYKLEVSADGGRNWLDRPLPLLSTDNNTNSGYRFIEIPGSPQGFLLEGGTKGEIYSTLNNGLLWRNLGKSKDYVMVSPYVPTTILGISGGKIAKIELPDTARKVTLSVPPIVVLGGIYFPATGHNVAPIFRRFWDDNGGLPQFGLPRTELFREINPADGKAYLTQYFERARLEYHPEHVGTKYEIQLGLLGNQLTAERRAKGEAPFKPVPNPNKPGESWFSETGHTLKGVFKTYWEKNNGLTVFGYPTSAEFEEISAEDGKPYTVQYFERARFEYRPENKGTPYEVLIGLLGNNLLRSKGWLD
jgi:hypothetical protein